MKHGLRSTDSQAEDIGRERRARQTRLSSLPWLEANESGVVLGEAGGDGGGARVAAAGTMQKRRLEL